MKANADKMLYGTTRQTLMEEHGEGFFFLHDYLNRGTSEGEGTFEFEPDNNAPFPGSSQQA
jgi:hypothetical protein